MCLTFAAESLGRARAAAERPSPPSSESSDTEAARAGLPSSFALDDAAPDGSVDVPPPRNVAGKSARKPDPAARERRLRDAAVAAERRRAAEERDALEARLRRAAAETPAHARLREKKRVNALQQRNRVLRDALGELENDADAARLRDEVDALREDLDLQRTRQRLQAAQTVGRHLRRRSLRRQFCRWRAARDAALRDEIGAARDAHDASKRNFDRAMARAEEHRDAAVNALKNEVDDLRADLATAGAAHEEEAFVADRARTVAVAAAEKAALERRAGDVGEMQAAHARDLAALEEAHAAQLARRDGPEKTMDLN